MRVKYQRTSTSNQNGDRFQLDKAEYDIVLFDKGISGTREFKERPQASKLIELVESGKVVEFVVEEIRDIGRNIVDTINIFDWFDKYDVNIIVKSLGI